jgi:tetratricopeptide (TPR) repeat protein
MGIYALIVGVMWYFVIHAEVTSDVRTADYHRSKGDELFNRKDYRGAIQEYTQALQSNPKLVEAYLYRGIASEQIDSNISYADYNTVLSIDSSNKLALFWRGIDRAKLGDYEGAVGDYTSAIHYDSMMAKAYRRRAIARYALHDSAGYIADIRHAAMLGDSIAREGIDRH